MPLATVTMKTIKAFPFTGKKYALNHSTNKNLILLDEYNFFEEQCFYYDYFFTYFKGLDIDEKDIANQLPGSDSKFLIQEFNVFKKKMPFFKLKYKLVRDRYKDVDNVYWLCSTNFFPELLKASVDIKTLITFENFEAKFNKYFKSVYELYYNDVNKDNLEKIVKITELACTVYKKHFQIKEDIYDLMFSYNMDKKCFDLTRADTTILISKSISEEIFSE